MMNIKVIVANKHIEEGLPTMPSLCPVALALREALPFVYQVYVDEDSMSVIFRHQDEDHDDLFRYSQATLEISEEAEFIVEKFIRQFDEHMQVLPFEFDAFIDFEV